MKGGLNSSYKTINRIYMTKDEAKKQIVDITKRLYHKDMLNQFEGNVSIRLDECYLITPSQADKETMTPDMIVEIDEKGNVLNPECGRVPSSEYKMHIHAYKIRPDVNACIHNHSTYATAFAVAGLPIKTNAFAEMLEIFQEVPLIPYGTPGTPAIAEGFNKYLTEYSAVLLENHGFLSVAPTLPLAFSIAEAVEKTAKILLLTRLLGGESALPKSEVALLKSIAEKHKPQNC